MKSKRTELDEKVVKHLHLPTSNKHTNNNTRPNDSATLHINRLNDDSDVKLTAGGRLFHRFITCSV